MAEEFAWIEVEPTRFQVGPIHDCTVGRYLLRAKRQSWPSTTPQGEPLFSFHIWRNGAPALSSGYNYSTIDDAKRAALDVYLLNEKPPR